MIYDVIIIGAGPCGLAAAARLREHTPSALFTDAEHARYWRRFSRSWTVEKEARQKKRSDRQQKPCDSNSTSTSTEQDDNANSTTADAYKRSLLVLDAASDKWMTTWSTRFEELGISHLRSPLFFHCDPRDRDGLLEFSHSEGRFGELEVINNVVGQEISKHQRKKQRKQRNENGNSSNPRSRHLHLDNRDQIDYFTPSSGLFDDHCSNIINRYGLNDLVQRADVSSVTYGPSTIPTESGSVFTITTSTDQVLLARAVVVAVGPGITKGSIPLEYRFLEKGLASHVFDGTPVIPTHLTGGMTRSKPTSVVVVGGGLTSIQLASLLINQHKIDKVHLLMRSRLKVKHFDVDLEWVSKLRNANMAAFWSADSDEERFDMLRSARGGGSIPPRWMKVLRQLEKAGKLKCWEKSVIVDGVWSDERKIWNLDIARLMQKADPENPEEIREEKEMTSLGDVNHVIFATGLAPSVNNLHFLANFREQHPIDSINGLPRLNEELMWSDNVPLFLAGGLAGLKLGPGAGNLAGARLGAERISWGIDNHFGRASAEIEAPMDEISNRDQRKLSNVDSAYGSGPGSGSEEEPEESTKTDTIQRYSVVDRSEFTGGFHNQFEALAASD